MQLSEAASGSTRTRQAAWVLAAVATGLATSIASAQGRPLLRPSTVPAQDGQTGTMAWQLAQSTWYSRVHDGATATGDTSLSTFTQDTFRFTDRLAGDGNPSLGGTSTVVAALTAPLPGPSLRGRMSATTNATFQRTHAGMPCVVLHWDRTTGAGTFGGIDYASGNAFLATKASWASPLNIISSLAIFGFDASRAYELTLSSGETRAVMHVKLKGVILHRLSAENIAPSPGIGALAVIAGPGESSAVRADFRNVLYEQHRDTDYAVDGVADIVWVRKSPTGDQLGDGEVWTWSFTQDGSGRPVLSGAERAVGQSLFFQPQFFRDARFDLGFKGLTRDLGDGNSLLTCNENGSFFSRGLTRYTDGRLDFGYGYTGLRNDPWLTIRSHEWWPGAAADFDANLLVDVVYNNRVTGQNGVLRRVNPQTSTPTADDYTRWTPIPIIADTTWRTVGAGDLDDDGHPDLIWQNDLSGDVIAWFMDELRLKRWAILGNASGWTYSGSGRFDAQPGTTSSGATTPRGWSASGACSEAW